MVWLFLADVFVGGAPGSVCLSTGISALADLSINTLMCMVLGVACFFVPHWLGRG